MGRIRRPGPQPISSARRAAGSDSRRETLEFAFEIANDIGGSGEEFGVILIATSEGDVVVGVFPGALVPVGAHALA